MRNERERLLDIQEAIDTDIMSTVIERKLPIGGGCPSMKGNPGFPPSRE